MATEQPLPLTLRIDLAEAFIELAWTRLPPRRTGLIEAARWRVTWAEQLAEIDRMLDALGAMYLERHLEP